MKKILVPTDFSGCSMAAVEFAAYTAKKAEATLDLLHVIDPGLNLVNPGLFPGPEFTTGGIPPTEEGIVMMSLMKQTKQNMHKVKSMPYMKSVLVTDHIKTGGTVYEKIIEYARETHPDIIIMGTHGASGVRETFIGSNAERVVKLADLPVLSIKSKIQNTDVKMIVFASDFSEEAYKVFPLVLEFAKLFGAKIHLMKVNTPQSFETTRETEDEMKAFSKEFSEALPMQNAVYNDTDRESGVIHYAASVNADLIALGTHGRGGLSVWFNPSISEELVYHSPLPVLTINIHKKKKEEAEVASEAEHG